MITPFSKTLFIALLFLGSLVHAQEAPTTTMESKSNVSLNGMRYSSAVSIGFSYRLWQNKVNTFRTGLQTAIGYGPKEWENFSELVLPFGLYAEYGKKHRIGFDANIIYQYRTREVRGISANGWTNYRAVYDNGAFTTSLYYSYNFGENMRYNIGLGGSYIGYFGSNYGVETTLKDVIAPFIFFGVRF